MVWKQLGSGRGVGMMSLALALCILIGSVASNPVGNDADVIIVGAGIAGLSAAATLSKHGKKCLVLEARGRTGGRMYTVHQEGAGLLELGAQWIHGGTSKNKLFKYASDRNLLGSVVQYYGVGREDEPYFTSQGVLIDEDDAEKARELYESIADNVEKGRGDPASASLRDYFDRSVAEEMNRLEEEEAGNYNKQTVKLVLESLAQELSIEASDSLDKVSLEIWGEFDDLAGGDTVVPGGLNTIIDSLAREAGSPIELNTEVTSINWNQDGVKINTNNRVYTAGHVIVTVPVGVLKARPSLFTPPLDDKKIAAIKNMGVGRTSKLFLEFDQPFWQAGQGGISFVWSKQEVEGSQLPTDWTRFSNGVDEVEGRTNTLLMWVYGDATEVVDGLDDSQVLLNATAVLRRFTGNTELPPPTKLHRNPWLKDPYTLGTWSNPSINSRPQDYDELAAPLPSEDNPRVLLAGEQIHDKYWSTMHGAMMSGSEQAHKIIEFMNENDKEDEEEEEDDEKK